MSFRPPIRSRAGCSGNPVSHGSPVKPRMTRGVAGDGEDEEEEEEEDEEEGEEEEQGG